MTAMPDALDLPGPVVLYDGECGLCHRSVKFLLARDRKQLWYAPLQGETAQKLRAIHPEIPATLETVTFDGKQVWIATGDKLQSVDPASGKAGRSQGPGASERGCQGVQVAWLLL